MKLALTIPGSNGQTRVETPPNIPSGANAPENILQASIGLLFFVVIIMTLIFTIYGGVLWVTSQGDKQKLDRARSTITYSIVGLIVTLLAFVIVQILGALLNIEFLSVLGK